MELVSLLEVSHMLGFYQRLRVRVEYVLANGARLATRLEAKGLEQIPPPPPPGK
jgi:hypothetical protein